MSHTAKHERLEDNENDLMDMVMALIDLRLSLELPARHTKPEVRAFIDLQPHRGLSSERELPLVRRGRREWVGSFALDEAQARYFLYRVALVAHAGASWAILFTDRKSGVDLLSDADRLEIAKCWLVGSCEAPQPKRKPANVAFDSARGATACRLLLPGASLSPTRHLALQRLEPSQHGEPKHDRAGDPPEKQRLFVLSKLRD